VRERKEISVESNNGNADLLAVNGSKLTQTLLQLWPALPYLGLGVFLAWPFLAYSGGVWLSDIEINGENISLLAIAASLSLTVLCLGIALFSNSFANLVKNRAAVLVAGLLGSVGSALIIISGPYYLGQIIYTNAIPLFILGGVFTGISSGALILRCGSLYSQLPPRRGMLYTALSHLLVVFIYFVVLGAPTFSPISGGPGLAGIIAFIVLLPLSAMLLTLADKPDGAIVDRLKFMQLPAIFWKFMLALMLFSAIISMMRSLIVEIHPVDVTLASSSILMLLRVVMAAIFIVVAIHVRTEHLNFGKLFSFIAITIVIAIALLPTIGVLDVNWNLIIGTAAVVFEYIIWCVLTIISNQKSISPLIIFGLGYGCYTLGNTIGWVLGVFGMTQVVESPYNSIFYLLIAGAVLLIGVILFSERDFARLFSPIRESELSLDDLMSIDVGAVGGSGNGKISYVGMNTESDAELSDQISAHTGASDAGMTPAAQSNEDNQSDELHRRGYFTQAMDRLSAEKNLSPRESEVLRYLAQGRGSDFIAEQLSVSWNTARSHIHNVYVKLDVHSRKELMEFVDVAVNQERSQAE
jgi:DNA-binding CsgD family transcriptional regulator/MFS family permease